MLGNRRVAQLVQAKQLIRERKIIGLQPKLTVGAADDQYEQEADRVARQVMNKSDAAAARSMQHALPPEEDNDRRLQSKPVAASITPFVPRHQVVKEELQDNEEPRAKLLTETSEGPMQRQPETDEEESEPIQAKSAGALTESFEAGANFETRLNRSKGRGSSLPDSVRTYMESRFGADFSGVRVHTGIDSTQLNQSVSARAFTVGRDIYYGAGKSPTDLSLTAHELTHVVQQTDSPGGALGSARASPEVRPGRSALSTGDVLILQRRTAPTEVRNVELRTPPKRPPMQPAMPRAVPASIHLAEEIDAANELSDDELIARRAQVAIEAAAAANDADAAARKAAEAGRAGRADVAALNAHKWSLEQAYEKLLRKLEAIEYVANWRRLPPLKSERFPYQDPRARAKTRVNFRVEVEERVRKTGSLNEALKGMPADAEEVQAIRKEAAQFRSDFKGEAWLNAERMLLKSQDVMFGALESYGLPPGLGERAVRRMQNEKLSEEAAAQFVIDEVLKRPEEELDKTVNAAAPEKKRAQLVFAVRRLKEIQKRVAETKRVAEGGDVEWSARGPKTDARIKAKLELPTAQNELKANWMEAEREHPILAAYRGRESELEKIDLGKLDVSAKQTNQQMKEVLVRVLPKLYDNSKALWLLKHNGLNPIALPPVVALTRATMFVTEGSIRAGVVRDLLQEEKSSAKSWLVAALTTALAIVTLLPTGGMSAVLIPAGIASAGFAAYSALKIYEKYEKQKLLVNTDLDLARALSNEEPSLRGFAITLVSAGLEGFALFRLWRKAVELRKLAIERQSLREAIDDFKAIMNEQKRQAAETDKFLKEVLRGTPAEQPAVKAGEPKKPAKDPQEEKAAPHERLKPSPPKAPAGIKKVTSEKAADLGYRDAEHVRAVVTDRLSRLKIGMDPASLPKEYLDMLAVLKAGTSLPEKEILKHIDKIMGALRNPKLYGDVMADAYQIALPNRTIEEGLMILARKEGLTIKAVEQKAGILEGGKFFDEYASKPVSIYDLPFKGPPNAPMPGGYHGSVMHIVQDLVINRARVGRTSYAFRETLNKIDRKITIKNLEGEPEVVKLGDYVWRSTYDLFARGHMPMPEMSGAVLKQFLKVH